jgi:hypothetical protein
MPVSGLPIFPVNGWGNLRNYFRSNPSIFSTVKPSQRACMRLKPSHDRMPLSSASYSMPRLVSCRFTYS